MNNNARPEPGKSKTAAKLIRLDGTVQRVQPANGRNFVLWELCSLLGCDHIEVIRPESMSDAAMVLDEEGKLRGKPVNILATRVWWDQSPARKAMGDPINGNALLCTWDQLLEEGEEHPE